MPKKVKVDRIVLDINGKKLELSLEDAQGLRDVLDEVLGKETIVEIREKYYPYVTVPYIYTYPKWTGTITCGDTFGNTNGTYTVSYNGNSGQLT